MQWFRFYTEAVNDLKLRRIARDLKLPLPHVIGVWAVVLSIASDSPERGKLLLSPNVPATLDDINDAAQCDVTETFKQLVSNGLVTFHVTDTVTEGVTHSGRKVYSVAAWDKRQFESDSSAPRVRKHRAKQKSAKNNADVTLQERDSNAPDTDTDTDITTTTPSGATSAPESPSSPLAAQFHVLNEELKTTKNRPAKLAQVYALCFGQETCPDFAYLGKVAKSVGGAGRLAELMFELVPRPPTGDVLAYIVAQENGRKKRAAQTGGNREIKDLQFSNGAENIYD